MASIRASQQGLAKIKQARKERGWIKDDPKWLEEASKRLESNWQEDSPYAVGISYGTWTRFLTGKPINTPAFKAFCAVLNLDWEEIVDRDIVQKPKADRRCSWGEAPDVSIFYGRTEEIAQLGQWIVNEHCRLVALLGMEGIGKTCLSVKLAQQIQEHFEHVIWRSLRNAPPLNEILPDIIQFLSDEQTTDLPKELNRKISRLIEHLHQRRCLVILDNLESILLGGDRTGYYRDGYEDYGELIRRVGESPHQSCLVLTSREKPKELAGLEGETLPVRSLALRGVQDVDGLSILQATGLSLSSSSDQERELINRCGYNPLALRIVSTTIRELYSGNISEFLAQELVVFGVEYGVSLTVSPEVTAVGGEIEASIHLKPLEASDGKDYLLQFPPSEAIGGELNILLATPGFRFKGDNIASFPLDSILNREISIQQAIQTAYFRLTALRPGTATITAELYRGDTFETNLKAKVQVAEFDKASFTKTRITTQPRPVPQPDFILRVQTIWNERSSACRFHYQLRSFRLPSLFPGETNYHSESLSSSWIQQMRGLLGTTLENISDALPEDGRSHLTSFGQYLFQHLLPTELQSDFRSLIPRDRTFTLLILADQDASLPWELLHDGQRFLSDRFIIGRWFWELNDTRPHEFPVGAINVAHYADVEQPELWTALLEPPGSPPPIADGVLGNLNSTEAMRGLHLIRYSQSSDAANRRNAPVTLNDTNNAQDIERQMRPAKLNLRRNRPLVSLGYVRRDRPELTTLEQTWASAFIRAGCSAFIGSLWAVDPAVEAAFISGFYNRLWTGDSLGEAFHASRQLARAVAPDSLDWLAYVLFGDPMARPYRPVEGKGYAVVEPIGREIDEPLPPGVPVRFRLSLRRTPPVWHEERVIEVAENLTFENLQAHVKTFGLQVTPDSPIAMSLAPTGNYLGWFTLVAPPEMAGNSALVQVFLMDGMLPIHSLMFSLNIENEEGSSA